jgi:hypothetical protein
MYRKRGKKFWPTKQTSVLGKEQISQEIALLCHEVVGADGNVWNLFEAN